MGAKVNKGTPITVKSLANIKYFDLIQQDINKFNSQVQSDREQYKNEHSERDLARILQTREDHPLRRHRDVNFTLNPTEISTLINNKMCWYPENKFENGIISSFAHFYLKAYENDMPVYFTTDSVLHAFHKSFNNLMIYIEIRHLMTFLLELLQKTLIKVNTLKESLAKDNQGDNKEVRLMLNEAEKYLLVAYQLCTRGLVEDDTAYSRCKTTAEHEAIFLLNRILKGTYDLDYEPDPEIVKQCIEITELIDKRQIASFSIFQINKKIDFSQFTPRSRYTKSNVFTNYFQAMMWLSLVKFHTKTEIQSIWILAKLLCERVKDDDPDLFALIARTHKMIAGAGLHCDFSQIYRFGEDLDLDDYVLNQEEKVKLIQKLLNEESQSCNFDFLKGIRYPNREEMKNCEDPELLAMHDRVNQISALSQSAAVDTWLMYEVTGNDFKAPRRIISTDDIAYALFDNDESKGLIEKRMKGKTKSNEQMKFRDNINYSEQLNQARINIKTSMETTPEKWRKDIYHHWLLIISKLSSRKNYPKDKVYDSAVWRKKQYNAQMGNYAELRHDMVLAAEQAQVVEYLCSHPEVYVEPNMEFWKEIKLLISKLKGLFCWFSEVNEWAELVAAEEDKKKEEIYNFDPGYRYVKSFELSLERIIQAVSFQNENGEIDATFEEELKGITYFHYDSYNKLDHSGWYYNMFFDMTTEDKFNFEPEIADIFTDYPDPRLGDLGCVLHIGTKVPKVGVILIEDKVTKKEKAFLMCGYNPVETYKPFGERLNDQEWKDSMKNRGPVHLTNDFIESCRPPDDEVELEEVFGQEGDLGGISEIGNVHDSGFPEILSEMP